MRSARLPLVASVALLALLNGAGCSNQPSSGTSDATIEQRTFASPEDAVVALIDAARSGDVDQVRPLFGDGFAELEADSVDRTDGDLQRLAAAYDRRHVLYLDGATDIPTETATAGAVTLAVGDDLWEFPVPIVRTGEGADARWRFDTAAGVANVRAMRINANEASALDFLQACVPAQEQFRLLGTLGAPPSYAQQFRSDVGTRNGLWWPDDLAPPQSPLGPMVDEGIAAGTIPVDVHSAPAYLGYRYRILVAAGPSAPGGAAQWLDANGRLVGGFAFVAWPEAYGETGARTFLVAQDGTTWARDLGPETERAAAAIVTFDPGAGWER
ncbi:MAG: DUF2950 family protein [Phycisphaerales bacterium]